MLATGVSSGIMLDDLDFDDVEDFDETAAELKHRWGDSLLPRDLRDPDDSRGDA